MSARRILIRSDPTKRTVNELANAQAGLTGKPLGIAIDRIRQRDFDAPHAAAPIELSPKAARCRSASIQ
jgi:hypothetical protein